MGMAYHENGRIAYSMGSAYHENGRLAYSLGTAYHDNGQLASSLGGVYHKNGRMALSMGTAYHENGRMAFNPLGKTFYDKNGIISNQKTLSISLGKGIVMQIIPNIKISVYGRVIN